MTLELPVDQVYLDMLDRLESERDGDVRGDLARIVENVIHENYQEIANGNDA